MGCIYKITNKINGKIYIGQTKVTEPVRWQQHVWYSNHDPSNDCTYLCNAIKKYGKYNFLREIIENIDNSLLDEREAYWIDYYDTRNKEIGYNLAVGGKGHQKYTDEEILKYYNENNTIAYVSKMLNANKNTIRHRLNAMGIKTNLDYRVCQYDLNHNLLKIYDSFTDACKQFNVNRHHIPETHYFNGYFWFKIDEEPIFNKSNLVPDLQKVYQYDTNCNFIKEYKNASEASKKCNINVSSIKATLLGKQVTAGGFIWHRVYGDITIEERYENYLKSSSCCEVEEYDLEGNILNTFKSATSAEKQLGWSYNSIKKVCDGKQKKTHNRYFRYSNSDKRSLLGI